MTAMSGNFSPSQKLLKRKSLKRRQNKTESSICYTAFFEYLFLSFEQVSIYNMRGFGKVSPPVSPTSTASSSPFLDRNGESKKTESKLSANAKRQKYFRRLLRFRQMDFEYAFWQMIYLFYSPQKV